MNSNWIETCDICSQQFEGADMIPIDGGENGDGNDDEADFYVCQGCIITQADGPKRGGV